MADAEEMLRWMRSNTMEDIARRLADLQMELDAYHAKFSLSEYDRASGKVVLRDQMTIAEGLLCEKPQSAEPTPTEPIIPPEDWSLMTMTRKFFVGANKK
jgi:hypothetical protein